MGVSAGRGGGVVHCLLKIVSNKVIRTNNTEGIWRLLQILWRVFGGEGKYHRGYSELFPITVEVARKYLHRWQNSSLGILQYQHCLGGQMLKYR